MLSKDLSRLTLSIHELSMRCDFADYQQSVLTEVGEVLAFDGAVWGTMALVDGKPLPLHWHLHHWLPEWMDDYNEAASHDIMIQQALSEPGRTALGILDQVPDSAFLLKRFLDKYQIGSALGTTIFVPTLGINYAVVLQRFKQNPVFDEQERLFKEALMPHLVEGLRQCRQFQIRRGMMQEWDEIHCTASADRSGILHDAEDRFLELLTSEWPDWQGAQLPSELCERIATAKPWRYRSGQVDIRCRQLGDLWLLVGRLPGPLSALSDRERRIATLFSSGESYSAIARSLNLAPSTVRNHLANVYRKLAVNNRSQLIDMVSDDA